MGTVKLKKSENVKFSQELIFNNSVKELLKNKINTTEGIDITKGYICIANISEMSSKEVNRLKSEKVFGFKKIQNCLVSNNFVFVSKNSLDTVFGSDVYIIEDEGNNNFVGGCREYDRLKVTNIKGVITPIYFIDSEVYEGIMNKAVEELTAEIKKAETSAKAEKSAEEKDSPKKTAVKKTATNKKAVADKEATA